MTKEKGQPNYLEGAIQKMKKVGKGQVAIIHVYHDDWCRQVTEGGLCNCNPDITEPQKVG